MPSWFAVLHPALAPVSAREIGRGRVEGGGVRFEAELAEGALLASSLRTPTRLLLELLTAPAHTTHELTTLVRGVDWRPYLHPLAEVEVVVTSRASRLHHRDTVAKAVRAAIKVPGVPDRAARPRMVQRLQVRLDDDLATLSLDAGGEPLHKRGWRPVPGKAPLRENLAAAMLVAAGYAGDEALLDPFCGVGTLPIEAALMASGRPPWVGRGFAWQEWPALRKLHLPTARGRPLRVPIAGSDKDPRVLGAAEDHGRRARVDVSWRQCDVAEVEAPGPTGLLVANPPYGLRLGASVGGVYAALGRTLRGPLQGWRAIFLAPEPELARRVHRDAERLVSFENGGVRVGLWAVG